MAHAQTPEQSAAAAAAELRALIREAHEAAQLLNDTIRQARTLVDDYLGDGVQQALDAYTGQIQAQIDRAMGVLESTHAAYRIQLQKRMQLVADTHCQVYLALAENVAAGVAPPHETLNQRRQWVIDTGNAIVAAYTKAGIQVQTEHTHPEIHARARAVSAHNRAAGRPPWPGGEDV